MLQEEEEEVNSTSLPFIAVVFSLFTLCLQCDNNPRLFLYFMLQEREEFIKIDAFLFQSQTAEIFQFTFNCNSMLINEI